jgi:hypothetical protein
MNTPDFLRACLSVSRLSLLTATGVFAASPSAADLILEFANARPDASTVPAYVTFGGRGPFEATATIYGLTQQLQLGQSYLISSLSGGVDVKRYTSGRVFVSLGAPLVDLNHEGGWAPHFVAPGSQNPNFLTRFDKYEMVYEPKGPPGAAGGANLSSTDFFGIPLKLTATGPIQPTKILTWNQGTATVLQNLGFLANYSTITASNDRGALVQGLLGSHGITIDTPNGPVPNVIRIVAPSSTNAEQTPFPSFKAYLNYIDANNVHGTIAGQNGQHGEALDFQDYNFNSYISTQRQTINGVHINPGDLVLTGGWTLGSETHSMTVAVRKYNLTDFVIYGANPPVVFNDDNRYNIVEKVVADYFSALNFGFIGSTQPNPTTIPEWHGKPLGASPSWTWYGNKPSGGFSQPIPLGAAYAAAQPNNLYYNQ